MAFDIVCPDCFRTLPRETWNTPRVRCGSCGAALQVDVFPARFAGLAAGKAAETILADGEVGCFYHPGKRAALPCDGCGRFLCSLCDVELGGRHICPRCLETQRKKGRLDTLETERTLYDQIALSLAILPMIVFYLTVLTAPATIFVSLRYWKRPGSLVRPTKFRFVLAMVIALLQIAGWTAIGVAIWTARRSVWR